MTVPQNPLPGEGGAPDATTQLPTGVPIDPFSTARLDLPPQRPKQVERTQGVTSSGVQRGPEARSRGIWKFYVGGGIVVAIGAFFVFYKGGAPARPATPSPASRADLPPGIQAYLEQAKAGDAHAMRMLGVMYYYGLNVPQDREEGLRWYRMAAEKGSDAAREELAKLEASGAK